MDIRWFILFTHFFHRLVVEQMMARKARALEELLQDNGLAYHIGQLIGAVEMTAWRLSQHTDEEMKDLAEKLQEVSGWFFKPRGEE